MSEYEKIVIFLICRNERAIFRWKALPAKELINADDIGLI